MESMKSEGERGSFCAAMVATEKIHRPSVILHNKHIKTMTQLLQGTPNHKSKFHKK